MSFDKKRIITHRGIEASQKNFFSESSYEAFADHLKRGFGGIEFDPNPTKDGIIVLHDTSFERPTNKADKRLVAEVTTQEATRVKLENGRIATFEDVMNLIRKSNSSWNAIHLKSRFQTSQTLPQIIDTLRKNNDIFEKIFIFDVTEKTARILKKKFPNLRLAPSIAHPYDRERFNSVVGNTLLSIEQALSLRSEGIIDGVWADEWDRKDKNNKTKIFYTKENFDLLHKYGLFIALVTPELHGTSPGLYGNESHEDSQNKTTLFNRIKQIIDAGADYLCTDYPEEVANL